MPVGAVGVGVVTEGVDPGGPEHRDRHAEEHQAGAGGLRRGVRRLQQARREARAAAMEGVLLRRREGHRDGQERDELGENYSLLRNILHSSGCTFCYNVVGVPSDT